MSYPKRCDKCEQFGEWCFCEPTPLVAEESMDLFVPEMWAAEANHLLEEAMVISRFIYDNLEGDICDRLDRVRINRGVKDD
jgi:hypothetical protein